MFFVIKQLSLITQIEYFRMLFVSFKIIGTFSCIFDYSETLVINSRNLSSKADTDCSKVKVGKLLYSSVHIQRVLVKSTTFMQLKTLFLIFTHDFIHFLLHLLLWQNVYTCFRSQSFHVILCSYWTKFQIR